MFGFPQCGPVAQLGARVNGIHEVTGSTPVWSTNFLSTLRGWLVASQGVRSADIDLV